MRRYSTSRSLRVYQHEVSKFKVLTQKEELDLIVKAQDCNCQRSKTKLICSNLRFVISFASQYHYKGLLMEDLISEANLGLIKAIPRYNRDKKVRLISYAVWWIRRDLMSYVYKYAKIISIPKNKLLSINRTERAIDKLRLKLGREPDILEVTECADQDINTFIDLTPIRRTALSLDTVISTDSKKTTSLKDIIKSAETDIYGNNRERNIIINRVIDSIPYREHEIICSYFGLCGHTCNSLNDIAVHYGMSRERVRQIKNSTILKISEILKCNCKDDI